MQTLEQLSEKIASIEPPRRFDPFSRRFTRDELFLLHDKWRGLLGLDWCEKSHIRYWHHRLVNVEAICSGRMAGDVREAVLRMMVAAAAPGDAFNMLEIGTLFGVNAAATWDIASGLHRSVSVTIIDPLDGYYGTSRRDPATGLQVSRRLFELNLRRIGVNHGEVELIQELSDHPQAISGAASKQFNYMFIDGDHSYAGVVQDWENYGNRLRNGGYVIFDNYQDNSWPEVTQAVDEIARDPSLELLGFEWHTAVFRKV